MFTTQNQQDFKTVLQKFNAIKRDEYNSYAYSSGYMESMLVEMLALIPKRKQKEFIAQIKVTVEK